MQRRSIWGFAALPATLSHCEFRQRHMRPAQRRSRSQASHGRLSRLVYASYLSWMSPVGDFAAWRPTAHTSGIPIRAHSSRAILGSASGWTAVDRAPSWWPLIISSSRAAWGTSTAARVVRRAPVPGGAAVPIPSCHPHGWDPRGMGLACAIPPGSWLPPSTSTAPLSQCLRSRPPSPCVLPACLSPSRGGRVRDGSRPPA